MHGCKRKKGKKRRTIQDNARDNDVHTDTIPSNETTNCICQLCVWYASVISCYYFSQITKLPEAKLRLGHHRLREVRAGGHSIDPDLEQGSNNLNHRSRPRDQDQDSLGSMEIAILGMACAGI